ncbi:MAG: hypothetical protein VB959_21790, partial [Rhodospirillales bacterium]
NAFSAFDMRRLPIWEIAARISLAMLVLYTTSLVHWSASLAALVLLVWHHTRFREASSRPSSVKNP